MKLLSDLGEWHDLYSTSVGVSFLTETVEPEVDLSEVLLDLDLMEDLLELLFGVLVEASLVSSRDSVSHCSSYHKKM